MVVQFQKAPGGYTHLLMAIDEFIKWVEARPITDLKFEVFEFIRDIIHMCGVHNCIITGNVTRFMGTNS
jgi:hypothetical protein